MSQWIELGFFGIMITTADRHSLLDGGLDPALERKTTTGDMALVMPWLAIPAVDELMSQLKLRYRDEVMG